MAVLREVQRLSQDEGISLAGIKRILDLEQQVDAMHARVAELTRLLQRSEAASGASRRVFAAGPSGEVVTLLPGRRPARSQSGSGALVVWRPGPPR